MHGPRSLSRVPAGSGSIRPRACSPARVTFRWRARPTRAMRRRSSAITDVAEVEFGVAMTVTRIHEDPRVTLPYTDAQWAAIDALGEQVDGDLAAHDVRLTQGGEPTFVSIDDMEGAEWNFTRRLSPRKARDTWARSCSSACAVQIRARGIPALWAGQVVSGRAAAALGARRVLAHRRPAQCGRAIR